MHYTSLISTLKDYSKRKNISDDTLGSFIESALSRANWALRIPPIESGRPIPVDASGLLVIPSDFLEAKELSVTIGDYKYILDRKSISEVNSLASVSESLVPTIFARYGNWFKIAPWNLGEGYTADLYYYSALAPLSNDNPTNWFTDFAPNVLLYGAMQELCDYTRDTEGSQLWESKFTREVNIIQAVEDKAMWAGSTLAVSPNGSIIGRG